jgi:hypothetical protein
VAGNLRHASAAIAAGQQPPEPVAQLTAHALATGFARGFLTSAGIALLALIVAVAAIRVRRQDLTGAQPVAEPGRAAEPERAAEPGRVAEPGRASEPEPAAVRNDQLVAAAAAIPCRHC